MRRLTPLVATIYLSIFLVACSTADTTPDPLGATTAPGANLGTAATGQGETPAESTNESGNSVGGGFSSPARQPLIAESRPPAPDWLADLAATQIAAATETEAYHDFRFEDNQPASGITFRNRIVPDGAAQRKANHYDHGTGVAAADVDLDGLTDLYFVSQLGPNELWRNAGDGTFELIADSGVDFTDRVGVSASFGDVDNDGDPDLFATSVRYGNALYENDGTGHFTDISEEAGVGYIGHSSSAVLLDYDRDGWLDIFVTNVGIYTTNEEVQAPSNTFRPEEDPFYPYYVGIPDSFSLHLNPQFTETSILYRNDGDGHFTDVTERTGLIDGSWSGAATPIDANDDGWLDMYVLNMQGHDQYYENVGGRGYTRKSNVVFPRTPWGSVGVKVFDFDNDERMDMYLVDMHSDMNGDMPPDRTKEKSVVLWDEEYSRSEGRSIWGNAFFHKTGANEYEEISDQIGAETFWPWGISVGDLNADGFDDVFVTASMNLDFRYAPNSVLLNEAGARFVDSEFVLGVEPRRDGEAYGPWFSLDCGGDDWDHHICVDKSLREHADLWQALGSRSSVIVDIENDGDLDIVTNDYNTVPQVLVSDLADRAPVNHLSVALVGAGPCGAAAEAAQGATCSSRSALGAVVTVVAGDSRYAKVHDGQSGYMSQSALPLYFGLGERPSADSIEVTWPSGKKQTVEGPLSGRVVIEEETGATG